MANIALAFLFYVLATGVFLRLCLGDERREDLIEDSVRRLLGLKPGLTRDTAFPGKNTTLPPRYMMDLYEKYRSGQTPMQGNTVRSILPMRDVMGEADVLIFNLTGISVSERILQSKLYILKRKKPRNGRKREAPRFRMKIGSLPNMTFPRHIDLSLGRLKPEWQSYDVTDSVLHCRRSNLQTDRLLGITLEIRRSKHNYRLSPFRRLLKQNSQPFLLIFSEESDNHSRQASKARPRSEHDTLRELLNTKLDREDSMPRYFSDAEDNGSTISPIRHKRAASAMELIDVALWQNYLSKFRNTLSIRKNLSLTNNHVHLSNKMYHHLNKILSLQSFPNGFSMKEKTLNILNSNESRSSKRGSSQTANDFLIKALSKVLTGELFESNGKMLKDNSVAKHLLSKRSISSKSAYSTNHKVSPDGTAHTFQSVGDKEPQTFNKTTSPQRNQKRNRASKKKKKKNRNRKLPFWWTKHDSRLHSQDYKNMCQRRSLVVDFTKLGWSDWVMSPKSFNAHYCTGGCSFPLIKDTNPSNHAALQSLMHALGLNPHIPAPCCVPAVTSPLTLLYFDEHGSLVLKNYPNMIVEKCACR